MVFLWDAITHPGPNLEYGLANIIKKNGRQHVFIYIKYQKCEEQYSSKDRTIFKEI